MKKLFLLCCLTAALLCQGNVVQGEWKNNPFSSAKKTISGKTILPGTEKLALFQKGMTLSFSCRLSTWKETILAQKKGQFALKVKNGRLWAELYDKQQKKHTLELTGRLPVNQWFNIVYTLEYYSDFAQGEYKYIQKLFLNGKLGGSSEFQIELAADRNVPVTLWEKAAAKGVITEVRLWNKPLYQAQIDRVVKDSKLSAVSQTILKKLDLNTFLKRPERYKVLKSNQMTCVYSPLPGTGYPLEAVFDGKTGEEVLRKGGIVWELAGKFQGKTLTITSEKCKYTVAADKNSGFLVTWNIPRPELTVRSRVTLDKDGLTADIAVDNKDKSFRLEEVTFPRCRLSRKTGNDTLLFPFQSGAEVKNPTVSRFRFGQKGVYPALFATMQFDAYYAQNRGVYLGMEDPYGLTKKHNVTGRNQLGLDIEWGHFVPFKAGISGGNSYKPDHLMRLRLFDGEWFEAGDIYREFLEKKAVFWIKDLPRKDTPERYRNGTITFTTLPTTDARQALMNQQLLYLRKYLDVPFECIHTNQWYEPKKFGLWPHSFFHPLPRTLEMLKAFKGKGIVSQVYIDSLLWAMNDGPDGKSGERYKKYGEKYAVKNADGSIPFYKYSSGKFAIECPGAAGWCNYLEKICDEMVKLGFLSIYHDQVGTCQPRQCFDPAHGHLLNDPSVWTVQGYRPLMKRIRAKYPHISHSTEDFSEVYANIYDSCYNWRWTCPDLVPVMQSIYCGRVQFVGKEVDRDSHGDPEAFFAKAAFNLVYGEWIANFAPWELGRADFKRLFIKRLVHIRKGLIDYFNTGRMLPPLKYRNQMPMQNAKWGGFYEPQPVLTPVISSNSFRLGGNTVYIFVNATGKVQKNIPLLKGKGRFYRCRWDLAQAEPCKNDSPLVLKPYQVEIRVNGSFKEAVKIQKLLKKVGAFKDMGEDFDRMFMACKDLKNALKKGELCTMKFAAGVYHCDKAADGVAIGSFEPGAKISYGEIDFGKEQVREVQLVFGVSPYYQGCSFEFGIMKNGKEFPLGKLPPQKTTGGVRKFKTETLKLSRELTGKNDIYIRYYGRSWGSNIAGWKY